jgi:hypothetical protein
MKFSAILLVVAAVASICGCRREYEPAPAPYYCQPAGCGCAPVPACNPCGNPCSPYAVPSRGTLQPSPAAPYTAPGTTYSPPPGTVYTPAPNPNASVGAPR